MKVTKGGFSGAAAVLAALFAGHAVAGGYGAAPYGGGYGPGAHYGAPYGGPQMAFPPRPQRPEPPARPLPPERPPMGPYGYGYQKGPVYAPGGYGMMRGHPMGRSNAMVPAAAPAKAAMSADVSGSAAVSISQMRFNAPTVTIKAGGSVTWTNNEGAPHTVTADDGSFGSSRLGAGDSFSHTFSEPGTYTYYCQVHPMMRATVVVEA